MYIDESIATNSNMGNIFENHPDSGMDTVRARIVLSMDILCQNVVAPSDDIKRSSGESSNSDSKDARKCDREGSLEASIFDEGASLIQ